MCEAAIYGYHGMAVNVTDGRHTYLSSPKSADNHSCNIYTAMPTTFCSFLGGGMEKEIECGLYLERTDYPLFKGVYEITPEEYGKFLCEAFDYWYNEGKLRTSIRYNLAISIFTRIGSWGMQQRIALESCCPILFAISFSA